METSSREPNLLDRVSCEEVKKSNLPTSNEGSQSVVQNEEDEEKFQKEQSNPAIVIPSKPRRSRGKRSGQKQRQKLNLYANQTAVMRQLEKAKSLVDESQCDEEVIVATAPYGQVEVNEKPRNEDENWITFVRGKKVRSLESNFKVNEDISLEDKLDESRGFKQKLKDDEDNNADHASEHLSSNQSEILTPDNESNLNTKLGFDSKPTMRSVQKKKLIEKTPLKSESQPTFTSDFTPGAREKSPNLSQSTKAVSLSSGKARQVFVRDGSLSLSAEENSSRRLWISPKKQTNDNKARHFNFSFVNTRIMYVLLYRQLS